MSQELEHFNTSRNILSLNQIQALKSLSQLLTREISSLESTPETIYQQIADGRKICLTDEVQKFEAVLIRCALNSTLNEKIKRLKINLLESA
jgi:hypothetical protein